MIKIICVGKIKESFYREAINEYLKRFKTEKGILLERVLYGIEAKK